MNKASLGLNDDINIYINDNLCPYYKKLAWKGRKLKRANMISSSWTDNGVLLIRIADGQKPKKIFRETDLDFFFPNFSY